MKLSVVMPVYNEVDTIREIVSAVRAIDVPKEIIIVDDGSRDGTRSHLEEIGELPEVRVILQPANRGKGAALRTGFQAAEGDIVLVQDADLEYDPREYPRLIEPILDGRADVVYGSRFAGGPCHRVLNYWHAQANLMLTRMSNWFSNIYLTDMETCYKVFRREVIQAIDIEEDRFGFEPEITAKLATLPVRIYEVSISYEGRSYGEGKKIGWKDAVRAAWCITKYNLRRKAYRKRYLPRLRDTRQPVEPLRIVTSP